LLIVSKKSGYLTFSSLFRLLERDSGKKINNQSNAYVAAKSCYLSRKAASGQSRTRGLEEVFATIKQVLKELKILFTDYQLAQSPPSFGWRDMFSIQF
jgi:hypothetical protein